MDEKVVVVKCSEDEKRSVLDADSDVLVVLARTSHTRMYKIEWGSCSAVQVIVVVLEIRLCACGAPIDFEEVRVGMTSVGNEASYRTVEVHWKTKRYELL